MRFKDVYKIVFFLFISFNSYAQSYVYTGPIMGISGSPIVNQISTIYNSETISGEYLVILGNGNTAITNPFIIIEGIDFLNNTDFEDHINLYNNSAATYSDALIYNLYINGFDVIILDFDYATDYIQNNSMLLVELINQLYSGSSLTDDNLVIMGYSMGGLVARHALTWMESNELNHHTRLYISHDSPHKGANFPLGIQELLEDMRNNTPIAWLAIDMLIKTFEYNMPAARQMLVYHYLNSDEGIAKPSDDKISFFNDLYNLNPAGNGYPSIPLKIAISNGNYSGLQQSGISIGDELLFYDYWKNNGGVHWDWPFCGLFEFDGCDISLGSDHITATVRIGFDDSAPLEEFYTFSMGKYPIGNTGLILPIWGGSGEQTFNSSNYSYDIAPGSTSSNFMNMLVAAISSNITSNVSAITNTCFIPTISALDLNIDISDSFIPSNSRCLTNFDYIYANLTTNLDHFELAIGAKDFILDHTFTNESPITSVVFEEANITIPSSTLVPSGTNYMKSASNSILNNGVFTIETGGYSSLIAGNSISLNPGFSVELGASFDATIADIMCESEIEYNPHYIGSSLKSVSNSNIFMEYDCENIEIMPFYSSDSIYFDCYTQFSVEQIDSFFNENIIIYPNPTNGLITIELSSEIVLSYLNIYVYNYMSNLEYSLSSVSSNILSFDLSSALSGLLTFEFIINNGDYIYTRKILKL